MPLSNQELTIRRHIMSVDVEDYFMVEAFADVVSPASWDQYSLRVEDNTKRTLELLAKGNTRATCFIVGWVAEKFPSLIREIKSAGHEIACHSFWHRAIYKLDPEEFRIDTKRAKAVLEQVSGERVRGYRAPSWSIIEKSRWALDILAELGFEYDSSIFPIHHDLYGMPGAKRFPYVQETSSRALIEFPPSTIQIGGARVPVAGGGYLRLFPLAVTKAAIRRIAEVDGQKAVVYFHPWEIDPEQPRIPCKLKSRFRHYTNLSTMEAKLAEVMASFEFETFQECISAQEQGKAYVQ